MRELVKIARWFPTAAEIRETCRSVAHHRQLEAETRERLALPAKPEDWVPLKQLAAAPEFQKAVTKLTMKPAAPVSGKRVIREQTPEEYQARLAELQRQKERLGA